jgi:truncated hemoglobin YjbI
MTKIDTNSQAYADFYQWVNNSPVLSKIFAATLFIYERMPGTHNGEVRNRLTRFWSGDKIALTEIKKWLKALGEGVTFNISTVPLKELALQRFVFAARLMVAAGYEGWVVFIDELELIGRYSLLQRARSYIELGRFMGRLEGWQSPGLMSVGSITDDFAREVLEDKNDLEKVPGKLRAKGSPDYLLWASQAERGMRVIEREAMPLDPPDNSMLQAVYDKLKAIHADAYNWNPPDITGWEKMLTDIMHPKIRLYVKLWITVWDLKRLDPDYMPNILAGELKFLYSEDKDLQVSPEGENEE